MDKIFYLTDEYINFIDLKPLLAGKQLTVDKIPWGDKDLFESSLQNVDEKDTFAVIFDFVDESVDFEWTPKLMAWEKLVYKKQIINNFSAKGINFISLVWLEQFKKNIDGASQQLLLRSLIPHNQALKSFFSVLEEAQLTVVAIYSYPFLLEKYFLHEITSSIGLNKNKVKEPFLLIVQETKYKFRQLFFYKGRLRISRFIDIDTKIKHAKIINANLVEESSAVVKFIYNQKILPFNSEIGFIYIGTSGSRNDDIISQIQEKTSFSNKDHQESFYLSRDLYKLRQSNKVESTLFSTVSFLAEFIQNKKITTFYSNDYIKKINVLKKVRLLLIVVTVIIMLFGSFYLLSLGEKNIILEKKVTEMDKKISLYQKHKNILQKTISLKYDAEDIEASVAFSESVLDSKTEKILYASFKTLSNVLSRHEHIMVSKLDWEKDKHFDSKKINIMIEGWVFPFDGAFEKPVEWVDLLIKDLSEQYNIDKVELIKEPLDRELEQSLSISAGEVERVNGLPFSFRLITGSDYVRPE